MPVHKSKSKSSHKNNDSKSRRGLKMKFSNRVNSDAMLLKSKFKSGKSIQKFVKSRSRSPYISYSRASHVTSYLNSTKKTKKGSKSPNLKCLKSKKRRQRSKSDNKKRSPFRTLDDNRPSYPHFKLRHSHDSHASSKTRKISPIQNYGYYLKQHSKNKYWRNTHDLPSEMHSFAFDTVVSKHSRSKSKSNSKKSSKSRTK